MPNLDPLINRIISKVHPHDENLEEYFQAYIEVIKKTGSSSFINRQGTLDLLDWKLMYVCGANLPGQIDATLIRGQNDFIPANDHPVILDCGSNIGFTVLHYKKKFPNAQITAFEPDPKFLPVLITNLTNNNASDVRIIDAAVWIENGIADWYEEGVDGSHLEIGQNHCGSVEKVRTIDLNDYLVDPIDLLKMDIEGAEYEVIRHIQQKLHYVKALSIECHIDQQTVSQFGEMLKILRSNDFHVSIGSYGNWRDLVFQPPVEKDHHENYILISAWRGEIPHHNTPASWIHSVGVAPMMDMFDQLQYEKQYIKDIERLALMKELQNRRIIINPPFILINGFSWVFQVTQNLNNYDDNDNPTRSTLLLFEDEKLLFPAHSPHEDIQKYGKGRYSHWKNVLYFSTSDGSDPNTNGKHYQFLIMEE